MRKIILTVSILALVVAGCSWVPVPLARAETQPVTVVDPVTISPPPPPAAPAEVTVSGVTDTEATISWSPVPYATQYSVWVDGQRWTGSTSPGVTIRGLQPSMTYTVYVTAANESGESGPSSAVSFVTLPPVPTAPERPEVVQVSDTKATVRWQPLPPFQYIHTYRIYVDGQAVADVPAAGGVQSAELTNLDAGEHSVAVSAVNDNREGPLSATARFTVASAPAPAGLRMTNHAADRVWLAWQPVPGAARYLVYLNDGTEPVGETTESAYVLCGLTAGTSYDVRLIAELPDGNRTAPASLSVKTAPAAGSITPADLPAELGQYAGQALTMIIILAGIGGAFAVARATRYALLPYLFWRWVR